MTLSGQRFMLFGGAGLAVLAAAATFARAGDKPSAEVKAAELTVVRAAAVERGPLEHPIRTSGVTRAKKELDLGFLVSGEVVWVGAEVGAHVRRGQVLARIDPTPVAADAQRARESAKKATRDLDRVRSLARTGSLPSAQLDDAETGESVASAQLRAADFALRHAAIVAPDDGVIDARTIDPGEVVSAGQPAFRMSGASRGQIVRVNLADKDVIGLEIGRRAHVTLDARPESMDARVSQIASAATPFVGTFEVELAIDPRDALPSGLTAKVVIERTVSPGAIIPVSALVPGERDGAAVFALDRETARRVPVQVLFFEGERAAIAEPLEGVARVASEGAASLTDGARAQVSP